MFKAYFLFMKNLISPFSYVESVVEEELLFMEESVIFLVFVITVPSLNNILY